MRIVVLSRYFWPDLGGAQMQLRMLARQWGATGHEVTVLTGRWDPRWSADECVEGYRVIRWPVTQTRFVGTIRFLWQIQDWLTRHQREFDVVMVSMLKHAAWMTTRVAQGRNFPVFLKSWGAGDSGDMAWQEKGRFGLFIRQGTKNVDGILSPSRAVTEELRSAGYDRIIDIPNGVPTPAARWNSAETSAYRKQLGLPDRPTIMTTGRLSPEKGLLDLIEAMPLILQKAPETQLVLVGEGPQRKELEDRCSQLGVRDRVLLPGAVDNVESSLRAADLYCLPSHFEGLSVALLEALALGLPATASDTPANLGILPEEHLPLFPTKSPGRIAEQVIPLLGEACRQATAIQTRCELTAKRFGIEAVAEAHIECFARAIAARRSR
jgi:glycosyltransferase involved in cell wall biosynthesis